ncbi:MAG: hypothetical protein ACI85K_000843 [Hyphomicrobiaceae bacterium]|jgi:hypothetical protein
MDANGDITDTFDDDDELANTIEAGHKGPWGDDSAVFEDPKVAKLKQEIAGTQTTGYQQRRMRELQERTAKAAANTPAAPSEQATTTTSWGEPESDWGDLDSPDEQAGKLDWGNQTPVESASSDASKSNAPIASQATKTTPNYARGVLTAAGVFAAATAAHGLLAGWQVDLWMVGSGVAAIAAGAWFGAPRSKASF